MNMTPITLTEVANMFPGGVPSAAFKLLSEMEITPIDQIREGLKEIAEKWNRRNRDPNLARLESIARVNGFWHNVEPFSVEVDRLRGWLEYIDAHVDKNPKGARDHIHAALGGKPSPYGY